MNYRRSTLWSVLRVLGLTLVLTSCRADTAPPVIRATPTSASPTAGRPTIRGTTVPRATPTARPGSATPAPAALTPGEATLLIEQAVGLLLDYDLGRPKSADLYQAAYDGALLFLARDGLLIDRTLLPLTGVRGTDSPAFHTAYLALANLVAPSVNQTLLAHAAIRAAVERTDQCQTTFLEADEFSRVRDGQVATESYGGIGIALRTEAGGVAISAVYPGSPAVQAGLLPGDRLLTIDGAPGHTLSATAVSELLRGPVGTTVRLELGRVGEAVPRTVVLTRASVQAPPFATALLAGSRGQTVAYVRLTAVTAADLPLVQNALVALAQGAPQAWVLDLRGSSAGPLDLLADLGGLFLGANQLMGYVTEADGVRKAVAANRGEAVPPRQPLAILLDSGTTLLGEALAAAASDSAGARLFGEPSAGCVATSALYPLTDGAALRITLDRMVSPQTRPLHAIGQRPDETVLPNPSGATDPVLAAALRWIGDTGR